MKRNERMFWLLCATTVATMLAATTARGQPPNLSGRVTSLGGRAVEGVEVRIAGTSAVTCRTADDEFVEVMRLSG